MNGRWLSIDATNKMSDELLHVIAENALIILPYKIFEHQEDVAMIEKTIRVVKHKL